MSNKFTQEYIEIELEKRGYKLIGEYINANINIIFKDKEGYVYSSTFGNLKKGVLPYKFSKNNPYTIQNIRLWIKTNAIGYELLSTEYNGANEHLIFRDKEGYIYSSTLDSFQRGKKCMTYKNNPYSIQNIKLWIKINAKGYELLSTEYINNNTKLLFKCPEGHKFEMVWSSFKQGHRCPVCSGIQVLKGYNDIATTDPWMIDLGISREDAEKYMRSSGKKVTVTCPNCGKEKQITVNKIYNRKSIQCDCGDGVSYPEKFIISMFDQLNIKYTKEYKPSWSDNKRYDFYLEDYNCIIECHGGQHYNENGFKTYGGRTLKEEQKNDQYKKELALSNNIKNYIILDCSESTLEQIKNSILNSELNNLFDLSIIDWLKCESEALSNKVKEVCDYWYLHNEVHNEGLTTEDISVMFNLARNTIIRYLYKGTILGWCNYNPKEESIKSCKHRGKLVEVFKDGKSLGIFESCAELSRQSKELFGVELHSSSIRLVCYNQRKHHKGFTFKYV